MDIEKIKNIKFEHDKRGGYAIQEVDNFLSQVHSEFVEKEKQMILLANKLKEYREDENSLKSVLLNAQKLADSIVKEANQQAEKLLNDAKTKAETIIGGIIIDQQKEEDKLNKIKNEVNDFKVLMLKLYKKHIESISSIAVKGVSDVNTEDILKQSNFNNTKLENKDEKQPVIKSETILEKVKSMDSVVEPVNSNNKNISDNQSSQQNMDNQDKQKNFFEYKSNEEKKSDDSKKFDFSNLEQEFTKM